MKTSEALYELIHSLTKNEKRYFKMYCSGLSGRDGSNYLLLFEALERQKEYDGEALKRSLKKPSLVKNLSSEKNYLFNLILDSLLAYHKEQPEHKIRIMMSKAQMLYDKSLVKASYKLLMSAKKLAETYEKQSLMFDILSLQSRHFLHVTDVGLLENCVDEEYKLAQEIINVNRYNYILTQLINSFTGTSYLRKADQLEHSDRIMQDELMQDESKALSLPAKIMFHHIWLYYYHAIGIPGNVLEINRKLLKLFEDNFDYTSVHLNDLLGVLANFISHAVAGGSYNDITEVMQRLDEFPQKYGRHLSPVVHDNYRQLYLETVTKISRRTGEFERTIALLDEMKAMVSNSRVLKLHRRQTVGFNTSLALFAASRYKEALRLLQEVFNMQNVSEQGAYAFFIQAVFLRLMIHYEQGSFDVLEEHTTWLRNFLIKQNKLNRTEDELLKLFAALPQCPSAKAREQLFREVWRQMQELSGNKFEHSFHRALEFIYHWLEAKVGSRPFSDVARKLS